jgi:acyl-CoA synthetase (AMP-forming)/AMP-acid ligase II
MSNKPELEQTATVPALLAQAVARHGEALCAVAAGAEMTYRELDDRSASLAHGLMALGVGKGSRLALLALNSAEWMVAFFACERLGAVLTAISTLSTPGELAHILRHSDAQVLITSRRLVKRDTAELLEAALPDLAGASRGDLRLAGAPFLRRVLMDDAADIGWAEALEDVSQPPDAAAGRPFLTLLEAEVAPSDDAVVIYTSGSTAFPKAVIHTQATVARHSARLAELHNVRQGERILPMMPLFWVGGLSIMLEAVHHGATLVFPDAPSAEAAAQTIRALHVDRLHTWPILRKAVQDILVADGATDEALRIFAPPKTADGAPFPLQRFPGQLGMTETFGPHSGFYPGGLLPEDRAGAFGLPIGGIEQRIVDPDGCEVSTGQAGELQLRGGSLMRGFHKCEARDLFTPDGFYGTQDMVSLEADGCFYFHGRGGDLLKIRGANVSRLEVEAALRALPEVAEAVVVACKIPSGDEILVAGVIRAPDARISEQDLKSALATQLSRYKVPERILTIAHSDLIWTASGKIKLIEMAAQFAEKLLSRADA